MAPSATTARRSGKPGHTQRLVLEASAALSRVSPDGDLLAAAAEEPPPEIVWG
jgi:hypothetical protein